jgi:hypothetical protein
MRSVRNRPITSPSSVAHAVTLGHGLGFETAGDLVVVGHRDDVEPHLGGALEDLLDTHRAVL